MNERAQRVGRLSPAKKALLEKMLREQRAAAPAAAGIPKRERRERLPLSFSQRRLWFLTRLGESGPAYNIVSSLRMRGALDVAALAAAVTALVDRHEALRTRFPAVDGEPYQEILAAQPVSLAPFDCDDEAQLHDCIMADAWTGFDLERGPLLRLRIYRLGPADHVLSLVMHHIISDGWTTGVIIRELTALYAAFRAGSRPELAPLAIQYADFTEWQHKLLAGPRMSELLRFWQSRLDGMPRLLELPADLPRPEEQSFRGRWLNFRLDAELTAAIEQLGARANATPFMMLLAGFGLLLGRLAGQSDLGIGVPVANRTHPDLEPLVGFFVNTLIMRLEPAPGSTFLEYLKQVRRAALDAFQHQDLPFERLVEELRPERDLSRNPIVQVVFAYQQTEAMAQEMALPGLETTPVPLRDLPVRFDIELHMWKAEGCFQGAFIYGTDLFHAATMDAWLAHFTALLRDAVARPEAPLAALSLLSETQTATRLHEWNGPANALPAAAVHELFAAEAAAFPDRVAVTHGGESITYAALNRRADRIARGLQDAGIRPEAIVALYIPRSATMLASVLGVLKAGAAYLPLDPANPDERNRAMMADSGASVLLIDRVQPASDFGVALDVAALEASHGEAAPVHIHPDNAAYVNFTSGSSGRPKGIVVPHRGIVRLVRNTDYVQVGAGETVAHASNVSFDAATFEIWGALLNGGRLAIVDRETLLSPKDYRALLRQERVAHVFMTTALFNRMVDDAPEAFGGVRNALFGGEMSDPRRVAALLRATPPARLLHVYGPTEATTFSTAGVISDVSPEDALLTIGRPIANTYARVLDEQLAHAAVGAGGQLYLGGPGLARGYLRRPAETASVFIPDPYSAQSGARLYATGDRARYRATGDLDILGRLDRQVKIRGFRIEPGEIEASLREHPAVRDAAVTVRPDPHGDRQLCAFVTPRSGATGGAAAPDAGEQVSRWAGVFEEHVYADASPSADPLFNTMGWVNSFDGQPIPVEHMRIWADDIVGQVMEHGPRRVLEIGCGSGMLLFRIAPECAAYDALDFSQRSLDYVRARIAERPGEFEHVRLSRRAADELDAYEDGSYDAVILNSVAQYFPDLDYLRAVIDRALGKLRPGGRFLLGDLRNYALLPAFHAALALFDTAPDARCDAARRTLARIQANETELCVAPAFFAALAQRRCDIAHVRVRLQRTAHHNELSRYRFNVVLTKGDAPVGIGAGPVEDGRALTLAELGARARPGSVFRLLNTRVAADIAAARALETASASATVSEALAAGAPAGLDPNDVQLLAESLGYRCEVAPADDPACFDAAFTAREEPVTMPLVRDVQTAAWQAYANQPLRAGAALDLGAGLREFLKSRLPAYMIPAQIAAVEELPLGPTGKVDYHALAELAPAPAAPAAPSRMAESPLEEVLCGLVADVLRVPAVKADDNFFELGGHSLLATSLAARISKAVGTDIPLKLIFEMPTVAAVARWLEKRLEAKAGFAAPPIVPAGRDRVLPASFAQRRLWFLEQMRISRTAYNMPLLLELRGHVDARALEAALSAIVERHEALRTAFYEVDGEPCQKILPCAGVPFQEIDLSALEPQERQLRRDAAVEDLLTAHFDLTRDVLLRVTLLKLAPSEYFLAGAFHHIASDGWSVEVFVREITALYRAFLDGAPDPLEPMPIQYADFAAWQREWLQGETLANHLSAWKRQLAHVEPLQLPADHERPDVETFRGAGHTFAIPAATAAPLRALTNKQGATLFMTLLAGFKALMHRYTGQQHIVLGAPIANRNRGEVEGLVGFFVNSLVLCTDAGGDPTFTELLARVRKVALDAYTHQDLPFEKLVEELHPERYLNRNPLFQVAFALQQNKAMKPVFRLPGAEATIVELPRIDVRFDMEIHLWEDADLLRGYIVYNADLFEAATIERMAGHYTRLLGSIAAAPDVRLSELEYLSGEELKQLEAWN